MFIKFYKNTTQLIFMDLKYYVPQASRKRKSISDTLSFNPFLEGHEVIGGIFAKRYPLKSKSVKKTGFWLWKYKNERIMISSIYNYFKQAWENTFSERKKVSPVLVGIGITFSDIPVLYQKFQQYEVDDSERIFDLVYGMRNIELGIISLPFFNNQKRGLFYPRTKLDLLQKFKLDGPKKSGKNIWQKFDDGSYKSPRVLFN